MEESEKSMSLMQAWLREVKALVNQQSQSLAR